MTAQPALLDAALDYAGRRKWSVFPLTPGRKEPKTPNGFYNATTNPAVIRRWWVKDYNIGIRTGAASGVWLLDVDMKNGQDGEASLRKLEAEHGQLPPTLESISGSGGRHLWLRYTGPIFNSASKIGPGLDVRGDGGYGVLPPSIHPCGHAYAWSVDSADEPAEAPEWLLQLARARPKPTISEQALAAMRARRGTMAPAPGHYGKAALEYEIADLAGTAPGQRNHALNRTSFSLHQLVAGGELDESEVRARLLDAAAANGLMTDPGDGPKKVWKTISSGARAGLAHPRSREGRT